MSVSKAVVFRNIYKDSIQLMVLSRTLEKMSGVAEAVTMVSSPGNLEMLQGRGLWAPAMAEATAADVVLFVRAADAASADAAAALAERELTSTTTGGGDGGDGPAKFVPRTIAEGQSVAPSKSATPNLALISVPGANATAEAVKAISAGMHVFMFSDNVDLDDEVELKLSAAKRGLLVMGPDCGTALLDGAPMGFCNRVRRGSVGLVGASGTGLQQVSSLIHEFGGGVSQMIGVGGRDLKDAVGGTMMLQAMRMLEADPATKTIVLISKPPSDAVASKVVAAAAASSKHVVIHFVGKAVAWKHCAHTLEDAARLAMHKPVVVDSTKSACTGKTAQRHVYGLFSGGTFEAEAVAMLAGVPSTLIDFGDDEYTRGKPHPMIDFSTRTAHLKKVVASDPKALVLMDVVLGHGAHPDPAAELVGPLTEIRRAHPGVVTVLHVNGTDADGLQSAVSRLRAAGAIVVATNAAACRLARDIAFGVADKSGGAAALTPIGVADAVVPSAGSASSIFGGIRALNVGVESFVAAVEASGAGSVTRLQWRPPAGGSRPVGLMSAEMAPGSTLGDLVASANAKALAKVQSAAPILKGVVRASEAIPFLAGSKAILHAGPPIAWPSMCGPMRGAIMGACIFEGWAASEDEARRLCDSGAVKFAPCHDHGAVGPMAGIIAPSFPLWRVVNGDVTAYSSFNEGLGKVLRFGAFGPDVIQRLKWMRDVLAPSLAKVLRSREVDLFSIVARALSMGDECHNRNAAASSLLFRELAPAVARDDPAAAPEVLDFINKNDHFFLNLSMAACKAALDAAANVEGSTLVTAMARNGVEFGLRLSGSGNKWFTTASPVVEGLFFPGFSKADANPDLGDSSITETLGIGGAAMAASPAITGFVGGNAASSLQTTKDMYRIFMSRHQRMAIPSLDFSGVPLGLDALRVLETNEMPVINTGIAHKLAGVGQIGAGICRAPAPVFVAGVHHVWSSIQRHPGASQYAARALRMLKK